MFKEDYRKELDKLELTDRFKEQVVKRIKQTEQTSSLHTESRPPEDEETKVYQIPVDQKRWKPFAAAAAAILVIGTGVWLWNQGPAGPEPTEQAEPAAPTTPMPSIRPVPTPFESAAADEEKEPAATAEPYIPEASPLPIEETSRLIPDIKSVIKEYGEDSFSPFSMRTDVFSDREYLVFAYRDLELEIWIKNEKLSGEEESIRIRYQGAEQEFLWHYWTEETEEQLLESLCPYIGDFKGTGETVLVFCLPGERNIHIVDVNSLTECGIDSEGLRLPEDMRAEWDGKGRKGQKIRLYYGGYEYQYRLPIESPSEEAELSLKKELVLRPSYDMDKERIKAWSDLSLSGTDIPLGSLCATLVWDGAQFRYENVGFFSDLQLRLEAVPDEETPDTVLENAFLSSIGEDFVQLDTESDTEMYPLSLETKFYLLDENNILTECSRELFTQKAEQEGIPCLQVGLLEGEVCFLAERYVP